VAKVLVVDDDPSLLRALRLGLQASGHEVVTSVNGEQGIAQTALSSPDIVVLDLGLPDLDGQTVCKRIRQWSDVPIIILSASGTEDRKVAALDGGADDYVTKPFGMAELEARIRTAIRHRGTDPAPTGPESVVTGQLQLDLVHHEARVGGQSVDLTSKEFDVLAFLARHAGRTCTHRMILSTVWGRGYGREAQYLHAYVHRLRQKLGDCSSGTVIRTVPGVGYSLEVVAVAEPEKVTGTESGGTDRRSPDTAVSDLQESASGRPEPERPEPARPEPERTG
jgi:two-component system, OmpR family, KDP operon response regulator KdpE